VKRNLASEIQKKSGGSDKWKSSKMKKSGEIEIVMCKRDQSV